MYHKRKLGYSYSLLSKEYGIRVCNITYLISLIHYHGKGILRENNNRKYSYKLKLEIINKVLLKNHSMYSTAIEYGLPSPGMLVNWIKSYKENGYNIVEKKRGRIPTMKQPNKPIDINDKDAIIKQKDKEIEYLKAENEYLKKLRAVILERKNRESKKK